VVELVVVHQRREALAVPVPDVPDEGPVVEQLAVLLEEGVAQPLLQGAGVSDGGEQVGERLRVPVGGVGRGEEIGEAVGRRALAAQGGDADDAVGVGVRVEGVGLLVGPAVAEEAGDGDVEGGVGGAGGTIREPLRRVRGFPFWKP